MKNSSLCDRIPKFYNVVSLFADKNYEKERNHIEENHMQSLLLLCHPFLTNTSKAITSNTLHANRNVPLLSFTLQ